jgi:hypothetical protein
LFFLRLAGVILLGSVLLVVAIVKLCNGDICEDSLQFALCNPIEKNGILDREMLGFVMSVTVIRFLFLFLFFSHPFFLGSSASVSFFSFFVTHSINLLCPHPDMHQHEVHNIADQ